MLLFRKIISFKYIAVQQHFKVNSPLELRAAAAAAVAACHAFLFALKLSVSVRANEAAKMRLSA